MVFILKKERTKMERRQLLKYMTLGAAGVGMAGLVFQKGTAVASPLNMPVVGTYDVLVCGGGTAGFPAAVSAARQGVRVGVIERYGFMGGVPATSIMPSWHHLNKRGSGFLIEFAERVSALGVGPDPLDNRHIEPEVVKYLFHEISMEEGVHIHLHEMIVGVIKAGNRVTHVITESKAGRRAYGAKIFIDATGDADVAYHAGAGVMKGDAEDDTLQGMSLRFRIGYIDIPKYLDWLKGYPQYCRGRKADHIEKLKQRYLKGLDIHMGTDMSNIWDSDPDPELPRNTYFVWASIRPNELSINSTRIYNVDGTDPDDLTKAELTTRKQAWAIWRYCKKHIPGFERSIIVETPCHVGVRETRRIRGDYVITHEDYRNARAFEDSVMFDNVTFDSHDSKKYDTFSRRGAVVDIPYRCFLPKGLDDMLVAGRCLSSDHLANSAIRGMWNSFQGGQVAGTSAGLSIKYGTTPRDISFSKLLDTLKKNNLVTSGDMHMKKSGQ